MIQPNKSLYLLVILCGFAVIMSGCAGTQVSKFSYNENYNINEPIKGEKCYDASVLLGVDMKRAKDIAKKVIIALDSKITEETDTSIKAQRNRYIGVFVGSGGEELAVNLKEIDSHKTFISATTKTGFVGGAGQKAWSCQIIDEMVKMASK
jgi:hypothetical protein